MNLDRTGALLLKLKPLPYILTVVDLNVVSWNILYLPLIRPYSSNEYVLDYVQVFLFYKLNFFKKISKIQSHNFLKENVLNFSRY